jgi:type VI secretion system protein ImpH
VSIEAFFAAIEQSPFDHDFLFALRKLETLHPEKPRIGTAARPQDEPVRFSQDPSLAFAPAAISALHRNTRSGVPRLQQRFFGMLGPNGPLPLHLSEFARERLLHHSDPTFSRFLDVFNHRFLSLLYRAWAQAQPTASLDRPGEDRFADYVGALLGIAMPALKRGDAAGDHVKLFFSGWFSRQLRSADGIRSILDGYFRYPSNVEEFVGHWMQLPDSQRTRLGIRESGAQLGIGAVIGSRVWDRQHRIRVHFGPLTLEQYESLLPSGSTLPALVALMRQYACFEYEWDLRLSLNAAEVPKTSLGRYGRLGWTTWLAPYRKREPAQDLTLDAERILARAA